MAFCREAITNRFITLQHIGKVVDIKKKREIHNTDKTVGGVEPNPRKGVIGGSQQWCYHRVSTRANNVGRKGL